MGGRVQPASAIAAERAYVVRRVRAAYDAIGRDPAEVTLSAMIGVLVAETPGGLQERGGPSWRPSPWTAGGTDGDWLAERQGWILGTPDEVNGSRSEPTTQAGAANDAQGPSYSSRPRDGLVCSRADRSRDERQRRPTRPDGVEDPPPIVGPDPGHRLDRPLTRGLAGHAWT